MTVGTRNLRLIDERFGDGPRYYLYEPKDIDMRVPDQIVNCVVFVGLPGMPDPEYRGTAFIVTVPGTQSNHFAFLVTAAHVAEHLEGTDYYIRINKRDGTAVALQGRASDPWWYHPTERQDVDAAVTLFAPMHLDLLNVEHIPLAMFVDHATLEMKHLGVGDEVFITGLFTKVTETTKNIPVVRTGTVAMVPREKIPWRDRYMDAYLIESRSIGGLSGSPVFIRETLAIPCGTSPIVTAGRNAGKFLHGLGQIYFLGSIIGHWDLPPGFTPTQAEAVNMGIAPVVPASKIKEIIFQPELAELMKRVNAEMRANNQVGAVLDFAPGKKEQPSKPFTKEDFEAALKKASRKTTTE